MTNWDWDLIVWFGWLALFFLLEIPAILGRVPWTSLSEFTWHIEEAPAIHFTFVFIFALLLTHLIAKWP